MTTALPRHSTPEALTELLRRVASQDAAALRALYDLASPQLFGIALRILQRREWAEEVLQEAFVNIWRYAGTFRTGRSTPMIWMAAIVRNRAFDHLRQQKAYGAEAETQWSDAFEDILRTSDAGPPDLLLVSQQARQLTICMARLRACERHAVALAYLRDQSYIEIADVLSVPVGTAKSHVRRGLQKLRAYLAEV
ncbi:RNA polymerase sigma factor [Paraburkholderia sp.]|uniref:RNA polymerase sigma factor n=1 Tax=Paraburkholderia sp. TaxID=1926495 RepID=UPI002D6D3B3B|nr:sigma-70 family RNA polymerase sigma factor [Paraburkholderia sp.]HZZ02770.1 sigma-70 family RNA polymerase sigma factor [Paraburkholderia sp.]